MDGILFALNHEVAEIFHHVLSWQPGGSQLDSTHSPLRLIKSTSHSTPTAKSIQRGSKSQNTLALKKETQIFVETLENLISESQNYKEHTSETEWRGNVLAIDYVWGLSKIWYYKHTPVRTVAYYLRGNGNKVVSLVFNYALRHGDIWGNGSTAPCINNSSTRWRSEVASRSGCFTHVNRTQITAG